MPTITQEQIKAITEYIQRDLSLHAWSYARESEVKKGKPVTLFDGGKIMTALAEAGLTVEGLNDNPEPVLKTFEVSFRLEINQSITIKAANLEDAREQALDTYVTYQFEDGEGTQHEFEDVIDDITHIREVK